ncbi:hypothetical protein [Streptomyces cinnamoneus]|uniref:Uncharacterized protein n=1 Tax=Streptomyces cinnamoneus TaxID=53446 RepID=A0A918TUK3_STRCJ|nr:hypothetical protein [Streptomyces cinnamoneus]GHC63995.1 hypothetical protein GCM10010507_46740 [Streptomyces cinnamoneus]
MQGRTAAAAWCGRLLLFAALLLGIVTMHTLGHPRDHAGAAPSTTAPRAADDAPGHAPAHAPGHAPGHAAADSSHRMTPASSTLSSAAAVPARGGPHAAPWAHGPGGMDPMAICLAVLGAGLALILLLSPGALRRPAAAAGPAWFSRALWPVPPPPRHKALARLSVLRV